MLVNSLFRCLRSGSTALILCAPFFTAHASTSGYTDPRAIDAAVAEFTGARIGEIGGARGPADRRLKLADCNEPLQAAWHGTNQSTVRVECPGPQTWRIYIATRPQPKPAQIAKMVKRGDPITVIIKGRGFSVQQTGEALEAGTMGDWIKIRTARQADPVRARIERPGVAVLPAG